MKNYYLDFKEAMGDSLVSEVKDVLNKILDYLYDKENLEEEDEVLLDFIYTFGALEEGQKEIGSLLYKKAMEGYSENGDSDVSKISKILQKYLARPFANKEHKLDEYYGKINLVYDLDKKYKIRYAYRSTYLDKDLNKEILKGELFIKLEENRLIISARNRDELEELENLFEDIKRQNPIFIRNFEIRIL